MKTFVEFKEYLQEKKSKTEYKATDLDKQITQEIDAAKEDGDAESISKLEAIRDEKDKEVKESRFKIYMNRKKEEDAKEDPDTDDVQEEINKEKVKGCLNLSKEEEEHKMEILRNKRKAGKSKINEKQEVLFPLSKDDRKTMTSAPPSSSTTRRIKDNDEPKLSYLDRFRTMKFNKNAPDFTSEQMKYYSKIKNYIVAAKDKTRALQDAKIQIERKYPDNPKVSKAMIAQANILAKQ